MSRAQAEVEDPRRELGVEHDVRRLQIAMLESERVGVLEGAADVDEDAGALRELERRTDPSELESLDVLHDDDRRIAIRPELEDADDPAIGKERHRARLAQELANAGGRARIAPDDLAGDDPVERQVPQLEDLTHAARAEPFDRLEAGKLREGGVGRLGR